MADTGKNQSFKFGSTTYTSADCIQQGAINDAINEVVYQCSGMDKGAAGTRSVTFAVTLALSVTDVTKINALYPGATGAFEAHPGGDTPTYIEVVAASALITQANKPQPVNGILTLDLVIRLNDITYRAASS